MNGRRRTLRGFLMAASAALLLIVATHGIESPPPRRAGEAAPPASRVVHLLRFHEAQDRGDLDGMLESAARLDAAGEPALGRHVRDAAGWVLRTAAGPDLRGGRLEISLDESVGVLH